VSTDPKFHHIVVDVETLSLRPTAAIMSIGAVSFDLHAGRFSSTFYRSVDSHVDQSIGGTVSPSTRDWWLKPENAVQLSRITGDAFVASPVNALLDFCYWLRERAPELYVAPNKYCVWALGSEFDPPILNEWARRILSYNSWKFDSPTKEQEFELLLSTGPAEDFELLPRKALADMRFVRKLFPSLKSTEKAAHHALEDCFVQYNYLVRCRRAGLWNGRFNPLRVLP